MLTFDQMKELAELVARLGIGGAEVRHGDFSFRVSGSAELPSPAPAPAA